MPTRRSPSTTGRWRQPACFILRRPSSCESSACATTRSRVITSATIVRSGSRPARHHPAHDVALGEDADEARRRRAPRRPPRAGPSCSARPRARSAPPTGGRPRDPRPASRSSSWLCPPRPAARAGGTGAGRREGTPRDTRAAGRGAAGSISTNPGPTPGGSDFVTSASRPRVAHQATRQPTASGISLPGRRKRSSTVSPTGSGSGRSAKAPSTPEVHQEERLLGTVAGEGRPLDEGDAHLPDHVVRRLGTGSAGGGLWHGRHGTGEHSTLAPASRHCQRWLRHLTLHSPEACA